MQDQNGLSPIFQKRSAFKPFEYPEVTKYRDAINHSYWLVSEWNFISDIHNFKTALTPLEQKVIQRALLAISQIEVSVKRFWSNLGNYLPKPEIEQVGITFGESEVRHAEAYSHLLDILDLEEGFSSLSSVPVIQGRIKYLEKFLSQAKTDFPLSLALFSLFIENISLFSQFLIIKSFNKEKNLLKDIDNVVQATQKEETIHAAFGVYLINQIQEESSLPSSFKEEIQRASLEAIDAETDIIDWIMPRSLPWLDKSTIQEFLKHRFNESLESIHIAPIFSVNQSILQKVSWFEDEIYAEVNTDFFNKRPVTYSKRTQPITAGDLF